MLKKRYKQKLVLWKYQQYWQLLDKLQVNKTKTKISDSGMQQGHPYLLYRNFKDYKGILQSPLC